MTTPPDLAVIAHKNEHHINHKQWMGWEMLAGCFQTGPDGDGVKFQSEFQHFF
jgi:hypothetical protein